jgi:hypothetical protein
MLKRIKPYIPANSSDEWWSLWLYFCLVRLHHVLLTAYWSPNFNIV